MAKGKARTDAQKERAKDIRIQRNFGGFTLADRTNLAESQSNQCAICSGPLDPPIIDHFHFKVEAVRHFDDFTMSNFGWDAMALDERGQVKITRHAFTKEQAIKDVRAAYIRQAIRGILCLRCNRGLGMCERFFDAATHPEKLLDVYNYIGKRLGLTHV